MTDKKEEPKKLAKASIMGGAPPFGEGFGAFYMPYQTVDNAYSSLGLSPEKLVIPRDFQAVIRMCYDFYQRGGIVTTVINRIAELSITEVRNGQRKTSDEANNYYTAVLHRKPSRMMRFLRTAALEYFLSGLVLPKVDWVELPGKDVGDTLNATKTYVMPVFDLYPPNLITITWAGWGDKNFYLKVPSADVRLIRRGGSKIKEQQLRYNMWLNQYPTFVNDVKAGADMILLKDVDPILRKEFSATPYPTPFLFNVLEALIFKQQLRRMDYAVAARVINAILLVQEGNDDYPLTEETRENLDELKNQILARSNNPRLMERLFILFSNHTTKLEWITPDVSAMLDQDKYRQTNEELNEGLGFARVLITGEARNGQASEVSTWAIQPQMEELRAMLKEWMQEVYEEAGELNKFRNIPDPDFKPIRLQDFIKTAAIFQAAFTEGNVSRTTRAESIGLNFETEVELMKDERPLLEGLPEFPAMPYSPAPGIVGPGGKPAGRPVGSQNVPVNKRNTGVKPKGQKPTSKVSKSEFMEDEQVIDLIDKIATARGIVVTPELLDQVSEIFEGGDEV
jgi:hypothetical protein